MESSVRSRAESKYNRNILILPKGMTNPVPSPVFYFSSFGVKHPVRTIPPRLARHTPPNPYVLPLEGGPRGLV